jgi:ABC transport system ATP-binding/permease protein
MSFSNWKKDQWNGNLDAKLKDVLRYTNETDAIILEEKKKEAALKFIIVKNEIEKELRHTADLNCGGSAGICEAVKKLEIGKFDQVAFDTISAYLENSKIAYRETYLFWEAKRDSVQDVYTKPSADFIAVLDSKKEEGAITAKQHKMARKLMGKIKDVNFQNFKNKFKNKALSDFVTNANSFQPTDEDEANLIQKKDPIYLDPYDYDYFKSHFYAPQKKIFGIYLDTFWANTIVIWLMTIFLTLTLFADLLKKLLDGLGKLGERIPSFTSKGKKK